MRLLILSPNYSRRTNWGHQHVRDYLLDLVKRSVQYGEHCQYKGKTHIPDIILDLINIVGYPQAILMENWKNMSKFTGGRETDSLKAFMVCDYYPDSRNHIVYYNDLLRALDVKLAICPVPDVVRHVENQKSEGHLPKDLETIWIPHGVDTNIFMKRHLIQKYDVMAVFGLVSYVYPRRPAVQKIIRDMEIKSLVGDWSSNIRHWEYARAINQSKIFVNCNGINNQVLMKYSEVMASGTLLLTNTPKSCEEFGFVPGKHFVVWEELSELPELIRYYLANEEERNEIAEEGMRYVRENFSSRLMAERIKRALEQRIK